MFTAAENGLKLHIRLNGGVCKRYHLLEFLDKNGLLTSLHGISNLFEIADKVKNKIHCYEPGPGMLAHLITETYLGFVTIKYTDVPKIFEIDGLQGYGKIKAMIHKDHIIYMGNNKEEWKYALEEHFPIESFKELWIETGLIEPVEI